MDEVAWSDRFVRPLASGMSLYVQETPYINFDLIFSVGENID